jgi:(1->4)-alpha-D-glucan 1-alpha-D-glucosylmutase
VPESFNALDELLSKQVFRLSYWKIATKEINYRRFFSINGLISVMVQDESVFRQTHGLIEQMIRNGSFDGLRVDHVDGLYDPKQYLTRLREMLPDGYLVVEKILGPEEDLPRSWPVHGTTGYDFMNHVNRLFCDSRNQRAFSRVYSSFTGTRVNLEELVSEKKRWIILEHMAGDVNNLAQELKTISSRDRYGSDITLYGLRRALMAILSTFPVYRTYIDDQGPSADDRKQIELALEKAVQHNPALTPELSFIKRFLLLEFPHYAEEDQKTDWTRFVMRFQQYTGPLMAKGVEDTALYVYNRLVSLNEVGGSMERFGSSPRELHRYLRKRNERWPHAMNGTATHDTKRGEDVRARINVLSEILGEWEKHIRRWSALNKSKKKRVGVTPVPDRNDEYFLYQTLIGAWPLDDADHEAFVDRMKDYAVKAVREAKVHTAWIRPDTDYEEAYLSFIDAILQPHEGNLFLEELSSFAKKVAQFGVINSLAQTLIKVCAPGVPDFYQGTELWDLNLVDPDNRRPVDYVKRQAFLAEIKERSAQEGPLELIRELLASPNDGRMKLFLVWKTLCARKRLREVFVHGKYIPLETAGRHKDKVFAFARHNGDRWAVVIVPRRCTALAEQGRFPLGVDAWQDTEVVLPVGLPDEWWNAFTDAPLVSDRTCVVVGEALKSFPVALLADRAFG